MKRALPFILISVLLLTLAIGCQAQETPVPPVTGGPEAVMVEISYDDFTAQNNITRDVELVVPGSLIVTLFSNPTTGYSWSEAEISAPAVIEQDSHNFVAPPESTPPVAGAGGKDVWVFDSLTPGTATIKMSYGQPWEGGTKDAWTMTLNVTVK